MAEITKEMRDALRAPLPPEAVSPHPTKTYLSSIKSIYVAERINDVFGIGSWTLKSELVERLEKFAVAKAVLEIPKFGFYGEAFGGNDNTDIGDAYKGATTDAFTKIAGQQLEIGIDVFKGLQTGKEQKPPAKTQSKPPATEAQSEKAQSEPLATEPQLRKIYAVSKEKGYSNELAVAIMIRKFNTGHSKTLTKKQASELIGLLEEGYMLNESPDKLDTIEPDDIPY